jgi:hypothetical protein
MRTAKINWMKVAAAFAPLTPYGVFFGPDGTVYGPDGTLLIPATDDPRPGDSLQQQRTPHRPVRPVVKVA